MQFIRLNGSIIFFAVLWLIAFVVCKYLFLLKPSKQVFMVNFGSDFLQFKIIHSFWSSLLYIIINLTTNNLIIFISFGFALVFFLAVCARRYMLWKLMGESSPFFFWRIAAGLLLPLIGFANELLVTLLLVCSLTVAIW